MTAPQLSIVIPCFNEAKNLEKLFSRLQTATTMVDVPIEFVLVNNGSQDNSQEILTKLIETSNNPSIKLVKIKVNQGYGYGIWTGLQSASGDFVGWTHADLQTDILDTVDGFQKLRASPKPEHSILCGRRMLRPLLDRFFTQGMAVISSLVLGVWLTDINAQPKIFHRSFLKKMVDPPMDFSLDLYLLWLARKENLQTIEQPVFFAKREFGEAKGGGTFQGKIRLTIRTWKYIFELRRKLRNR
jgi:glycosyltransferase involved in cell wall biosynthesis